MSDGWPLSSELALDPSRSGAKASRLGALMAAGLPVPPGWVIGTGDDPRAAAERLVASVSAQRYAVRSSSPVEDGEERSGAGLFATELDVSPQGLAASISRVRATSLGPAPVLVMEAFDADWAGIAMTVDPVTSEDVVVIEAIRRDRSAVTGRDHSARGRVRDGILGASDGAPPPGLLEQVAALAVRAADRLGAPQDVEWLTTGGRLWLVQSRPITAAQLPVPVDVPPGQRWERSRDHWWRPPFVLEHSVWAPRLEASMRRAMAAVGAPVETLRQELFGGWAYHRLVSLGDRGRDDEAPPPAWLIGLVARLSPTLRRRLRRAALAAHPDEIAAAADAWQRHGREQLDGAFARLAEVDLGRLDERGLWAHLARTGDHLQHAADVHAELPARTTFAAVGRLGTWCATRLGWDAARTLTAVSAASVPRGWDAEPTAFGVDLTERAARRSAARSAEAPVRGHVPSIVLDGLPDALAQELRDRLALAARCIGFGDETEHVVLRALDLLRNAVWEAADRLTDRLPQRSDVLHLRESELLAMLRGEPAPNDLSARRARHRWATAHPGPAAYGPERSPPPSLRRLPEPGRSAWSALIWAVDALDPSPPRPPSGLALEGIAASAGVGAGPARVIREPAELGRLRPGEVLVCRTTLASWVDAFAHLAGIVAETGGALSHPAILARERRVPAVVGARGALDRIIDGDWLVVDGTRGVVTVHDRG